MSFTLPLFIDIIEYVNLPCKESFFHLSNRVEKPKRRRGFAVDLFLSGQHETLVRYRFSPSKMRYDDCGRKPGIALGHSILCR